MKVAVIGSRTYPNLDDVTWFVEGLGPNVTIVTGGAGGVDQAAADAATRVLIVKPDYKEWNRKAPLIRNNEIVRECDRLVAFWDGESRGTEYTIRKAKEAGIPFEVRRATD